MLKGQQGTGSEHLDYLASRAYPVPHPSPEAPWPHLTLGLAASGAGGALGRTCQGGNDDGSPRHNVFTSACPVRGCGTMDTCSQVRATGRWGQGSRHPLLAASGEAEVTEGGGSWWNYVSAVKSH